MEFCGAQQRFERRASTSCEKFAVAVATEGADESSLLEMKREEMIASLSFSHFSNRSGTTSVAVTRSCCLIQSSNLARNRVTGDFFVFTSS